MSLFRKSSFQVAMHLPNKKPRPAKPNRHINNLFYCFFITIVFTNTNPFIMELKLNESKKFEDLTITVTDGGHKILMDENGKRNGDLSFAELTLQTPKLSAQKFRVYHPASKNNFNRIILFDDYKVTTKDMDWNGASVKLEIEKTKMQVNDSIKE